MKKLMIVAAILAVVGCAMGVTLNAVPASENKEDLRLLRTVTANDTPLTTSTKTWTVVGSSSAWVPIPDNWSWVSISAYAYGDGDGAGDPSSGTCNYTVLGVRRAASAQIVCTGALAVGGLQMSHQPYGAQTVLTGASSYRWMEGPPTCTSYWMTSVQYKGTTDDIGSLSFSTNGLCGFTVEITGMTNVTSVTIVYTGGA